MKRDILRDLILILTYIGVALNFPLYRSIHSYLEPGISGGFFLGACVLLITGANAIIFSLFWSWRYHNLYIAAWLGISSAAFLAAVRYGVLFDRWLVQSLFETNAAEATSFLSLSNGLAWMALTLPALWISYRPRSSEPLDFRSAATIRFTLLGLGVVSFLAPAGLFYKGLASIGRNHRSLRYQIVPLSGIDSARRLAQGKWFERSIPFQRVGLDATRVRSNQEEPRRRIFVLVVGETARAANYPFSGYPRDTNPFTKDLGLLSFEKVQSCGTMTAVSLPCMFSDQDRDHFDGDRVRQRENLLDILVRSGYSVEWRENNTGCKGICDRIPSETMIMTHPQSPLCEGGTCYDEVLLEGLTKKLESSDQDQVVVLHLLGSHGPTYYRRYPPDQAFFQPDCPRKDIENCSDEEIRNSYDNTIRYTDKVLSRVIEVLKQQADKADTAMLYLSDHGESLGEYGIYLHGTPYAIAPAVQTSIPMQLWISPSWKARASLNQAALERVAHSFPLSHDNLFHSVLGLLDVRTEVYRPELDVFHLEIERAQVRGASLPPRESAFTGLRLLTRPLRLG